MNYLIDKYSSRNSEQLIMIIREFKLLIKRYFP